MMKTTTGRIFNFPAGKVRRYLEGCRAVSNREHVYALFFVVPNLLCFERESTVPRDVVVSGGITSEEASWRAGTLHARQSQRQLRHPQANCT
jgi:hypothetical protein